MVQTIHSGPSRSDTTQDDHNEFPTWTPDHFFFYHGHRTIDVAPSDEPEPFDWVEERDLIFDHGHNVSQQPDLASTANDRQMISTSTASLYKVITTPETVELVPKIQSRFATYRFEQYGQDLLKARPTVKRFTGYMQPPLWAASSTTGAMKSSGRAVYNPENFIRTDSSSHIIENSDSARDALMWTQQTSEMVIPLLGNCFVLKAYPASLSSGTASRVGRWSGVAAVISASHAHALSRFLEVHPNPASFKGTEPDGTHWTGKSLYSGEVMDTLIYGGARILDQWHRQKFGDLELVRSKTQEYGQ